LTAFRVYSPFSKPLVNLLASFLTAAMTSVIVLSIFPASRKSLFDVRGMTALMKKPDEAAVL